MGTRPRLTVGLDGLNLAMLHGTGVATYARSLSFALKDMGASVDVIYGLQVPRRARSDLRETLFYAALAEGRAGDAPPERRSVWARGRGLLLSPRARDLVEVPLTGRVDARALAQRMPAYDRLFCLPHLFHVAARHFRRYGRFMTVRAPDPPEVMHWTYPLPLRLAGARNLYTLHDLVPLRLPFTSLDDRVYYDRLIRACVAGGDHICTVSETSRLDIVKLFGVHPGRITNTYQAVQLPEAVAGMDDETLAGRLRSLFGLEPRSYFLFFGAIEPKKNLGRLIEAYVSADIDTPLVIAGPRAWKAEQELRLLEGREPRLPASERIRLLGYLPRDHLLMLVRGAKAALFPSLYEGFGLPALEAMSLGVPLLASSGGALPELVADAALLIDPYDVGAMAAALRCLDTDALLRRRLGAAGPLRAEAFSMARYRERLADLYDRVLERPVHEHTETGSFPAAKVASR